MKALSIRWRLTIWYGVALLAVLLAFGAAVYYIMHRALIVRLDAGLSEELGEMVREAEHAATWDRLETELHRQFDSHEGYEFQVATRDGEVLFRSQGLGEVHLPAALADHLAQNRSCWLAGLGEWRVQNRFVDGPDRELLVQAAAPLEPLNEQMAQLLTVFLLAGPLAIAGALGGGYALAWHALAPVDRMSAAAEEITATSLNRRLEAPEANDELGRLARTLNGMIARIERSFSDIQRFTADAAHELRTPLSVMRTEAEVALRSPRSPEEYRDVLGVMLEEIERLTHLSEQLLLLCRFDAGDSLACREPVAIGRVMREVADQLRAVAEPKGVCVSVAASDENDLAIGDASQLRRLLSNLLDNAIKYTPSDGRVTARVERQGGQLRVIVEDTGIGIPADHLSRVCERFYRVDPSRDQAIEGAGLGLSICRAIAKAHGGELLITSQAGCGTTCTLILPASASCGDSSPAKMQDRQPAVISP